MEQEYWLIRGPRIVQQIEQQQKELEEQKLVEYSTVSDLEDNIVQAFPATHKRHRALGEVSVTNIQFIPYVGVKMLHIRSSTLSNGNPYKQAIQFLGVVFEPEDTPTNASFEDESGEEYHVQQINLQDINVKVRCNCLDFRFRFANYNNDDKSLVGKPPPPYQRKTTTRPEVNPGHVPGVCKHLLKVLSTLQHLGLVNSLGQ